MTIDPWLLLLAWAAVWADGPVPAGLEARPGFGPAVAQICVVSGWARASQLTTCTVAEARDLRERLRDAPPLWVLDVLPSEAWLDQEVAFADAHLAWLAGQRRMSSPGSEWLWDEWIADVGRRRRGYWALSQARWSARSEYAEVVCVREQLLDAQRVFGRQALEVGVLPPVVPTWRFRRGR